MTSPRYVWLVCGLAVLALDTLGWAIASALGATPRAGAALGRLSIGLVALSVVFTGWVWGYWAGWSESLCTAPLPLTPDRQLPRQT